jgi:hypothetical protein
MDRREYSILSDKTIKEAAVAANHLMILKSL